MGGERHVARTVPQFVVVAARVALDHQLAAVPQQVRAGDPVVAGGARVELHQPRRAAAPAGLDQHRVARHHAVVAPVAVAQLAAVHDVARAGVAPAVADAREDPGDAVQEEGQLVEVVDAHLHQLEAGGAPLADFPHAAQRADAALRHQPPGQPQRRSEAELVAHRELHAGRGAVRRHAVGALQVECQRLLAQHVDAGVGRGAGDRGVQRGVGADADQVEPFAGEHLAVVGIAPGHRELVGARLQPLRVDVAHRGQGGGAEVGVGGGMTAADAAAANDSGA